MELIGIIVVLGAVAAAFMAGRVAGKSGQAAVEERCDALILQLQEAKEALERETLRANEAEKSLVALESDFRNLTVRLEEQKKEAETMEERLRERFENLANKILEDNSKRFTEQNREKLDQLLKPLGQKIEEFRKKVEEGQKEDIRGRSALQQHLKMLQDLNQNMAEEAKNLTRALKGDTKTQGNWGEVVLQRILERSGLEKGREYEIQQSFTTPDGRRLQPDVIVNLPDRKHLVIDAKVSLVAFERHALSDDPEERESALRSHVSSIRAHVRGLSEKNYQNLYGIQSPDFVLMFIPVEPAFAAAMQADPDLYNEAFERNIILVSPTTLLATLATIENVWKQEYQNRNAQQIASRGGALYDKFVLFVESLKEIGMRLEQTRKSYDAAMGRLQTGSGNLVRQVEMLRTLGARTTKKLPEEMIDLESGDLAEPENLPLAEGSWSGSGGENGGSGAV